MKTTIIFAVCLISFFLPCLVLGIGQLTEPLIIENVLRGHEIESNLVLLNSGDEEVVYELVAEGDIKDWTSFYQIEDKSLENPITEIQVPPATYLDVPVKFSVPEDVPNGQYLGQIAVMSIPVDNAEATTTSIAVRQRIDREVSITVTDEEIINLETAVIPLRYRVGENEPLQIKVIYDNQGNILIKPDMQLKIIRNGQTIFNAIFPYPEDEDGVKPLERKTMPMMEWQTQGWGNGKYRAEVKILLNDEIVKEDGFSFYIGLKTNNLLGGIATIGGDNLKLTWFAIGSFFVLLAGILVAIYKYKGIFKRSV